MTTTEAYKHAFKKALIRNALILAVTVGAIVALGVDNHNS